MTLDRAREDSGQALPTRWAECRRIFSSAATWTWILVALGVVLRLVEYGSNRPLYMDERLLLQNLTNLSIFDFTTTLKNDQLAAPAFLALERMMVRLPLPTIWAGRLVPLLSGIASMFLMRSVARRYVSPLAVPIAVGLFAFDDWVLYYAAEIKQYSSDATLALIALWLAHAASDLNRRSVFAIAAFGAVGVWFSHPLCFVLGAVGTYLAAKAALRRDGKLLVRLLGVGALWAGSFAVSFTISHRILSKEQFVWNWWDFAFLPFPPRSFADLSRDFWHVLNVFNSPAWVITPLNPLYSALIAMGLYVIGAISLGLRWRGGLYLLVAPILFTLFASGLHQYPFHGRLLLFLVPMVQLLVAEGVVALSRPGGTRLTVVLGLMLLCGPAFDCLWKELVVTRIHGGYDSHGDLLPDLLDYLERTRWRPGQVNGGAAPGKP